MAIDHAFDAMLAFCSLAWIEAITSKPSMLICGPTKVFLYLSTTGGFVRIGGQFAEERINALKR
jgi:hypothetical protein